MLWTILILSHHLFCKGDIDFSLSGSLRSFPIAVSPDIEVGYGQTLWGVKNDQDPLYGYVRIMSQASVLGVYNSGGVELEIFPISLLGFSAGTNFVQSATDFSQFDCQAFQCRVNYRANHGRLHLTLGVWRFFVYGQWKIERYLESNAASTFLDANHGVRVSGENDESERLIVFSGVRISANWRLVGIHSTSRSKSLEDTRFLNLGGVSRKSDSWTYLLALGHYQSTLLEPQPTALLQIRWSPYESLSIY